jgi:two-component system, NtrC family, nitrogen regulation sensor histidine kinase NtrY
VRLALRLALTFGFLAAASSVLLGAAVRTRLVDNETERFRKDLDATCGRLRVEVYRQATADHALVARECKAGSLVQRVGIAIDQDVLDDRRTGFSENVRDAREAMSVDELLLAAEKGEIVGIAPPSLGGMPAAEVDRLARGETDRWSIRKGPVPAFVSRCRDTSQGGKLVALVEARWIDPLLARLGDVQGVSIVPKWPKPTFPATGDAPAPAPHKKSPKHDSPPANAAPPRTPAPPPPGASQRVGCSIEDASGNVLAFDVVKSTHDLEESLQAVDRAIGLAALFAAGVAFLVAIVLARSVSRPLADLAQEAGKVAAG